MRRSSSTILILAAAALSLTGGCSLIVPEIAHQPVIRNPFPQLRRVAVAPFFNQSDEPTLDGRQVAISYFSELQATPGFEVVPVGVVEEAIIANRVDLSGPGEARRLAQILGVDVIAIGTVTEFSEYYPPRIGMRVDWYTANPGFHEIPAGYGLPWGTPEEEFIPDSLVYESQMALARTQMEGLTPDCEGLCQPLPPPPPSEASEQSDSPVEGDRIQAPADAPEAAPLPAPKLVLPPQPQTGSRRSSNDATNHTGSGGKRKQVKRGDAIAATGASGAVVTAGAIASCEPAADGSTGGQAAQAMQRPECIPYDGPVMTHTRIYQGDDGNLAEALEGYASFRHDERFGGWRSYLRRSDDFTRFCCRMHIDEMLSARGGSRKTQVVWRWPESR
jgi:hypothetical protein